MNLDEHPHFYVNLAGSYFKFNLRLVGAITGVVIDNICKQCSSSFCIAAPFSNVSGFAVFLVARLIDERVPVDPHHAKHFLHFLVAHSNGADQPIDHSLQAQLLLLTADPLKNVMLALLVLFANPLKWHHHISLLEIYP